MPWRAPNLLSNLRLRTKFLLSLSLVTVALSCATLFAVRSSGENHARQELVAGTHTSLMTFDVLFRQKQTALARKADLLATQAAMAAAPDDVQDTDQGNAQHASQAGSQAAPTSASASDPDADALSGAADPLESDGSDVVAVADTPDKYVVLHSRETNFPPAEAEQMLKRSLASGSRADWWYVGGALYQVALQRIGSGPGTVIVGREIDYRAVHDLGRMSDSEVVFTFDQNVVASTFRPIEEEEAGQALRAASSGQMNVSGEKFFADSEQLSIAAPARSRASPGPEILQRRARISFGAESSAARARPGRGGGRNRPRVRDRRHVHAPARGSSPPAFPRIERGDYGYPLHAHGGDEVAHATRAFGSHAQSAAGQRSAAASARRAASPVAKDGSARPARRRRGARLQQPAHGRSRVYSELIVDPLPTRQS